MPSLKKLWKKLTGKSDLQSFQRQQEKFHDRYPYFEMGVGTYGMPIVHYTSQDIMYGSTLRIGAYCSIAANVQIFLGGQHRIDWVSTYPFPFFFEKARHIDYGNVSKGDVVIGSDVWLCANCIILSGVNIGHGAVIANGAMVTRDVPPYAVVAGNPAKIIRWRFEEEKREALLSSAWWLWPEQEINLAISRLCSEDIDSFITYVEQRSMQTKDK